MKFHPQPAAGARSRQPSLILFSLDDIPTVSEDTYRSVTEHPITQYRCGARAGDQVRLRRDIGEHPVGEVWSALSGAAEEPIVVWLRQADGGLHTWSDDEDFLATFELLPRDVI